MTPQPETGRPESRDLQLITWTLAILIAFILLFAVSSVLALSNITIFGLMAGFSAATRFGLSVLLDA